MNEEEMMKKIFTEEPEQELWRFLLQFSYEANILRYFKEHHITIRDCTKGDNTENVDLLLNSIAGAVLQANEYYKMSKRVSLQIAPLLLYYGTTNLFYAMSLLLRGNVPKISNHGMRLNIVSDQTFVADIDIKFVHSRDGGIHVYAKDLGFHKNMCEIQEWKLSDFLDSIAEIRDDFDRCYRDKKSHVIMLDVVKTPGGIVEKAVINEKDISRMYKCIEGFSSAYLKPQYIQYRNNSPYFVLRHKMNGREIRQTAFSGQPYLQVGHEKAGKLITIPKEINMYVALFVFGNLCRYHPGRWNTFVTQDATGEKLLVEKLLYYSRRILPNIVLNRILKNTMTLGADTYAPEDRIHLMNEREVREMIKEEIQAQIRADWEKSTFQKG